MFQPSFYIFGVPNGFDLLDGDLAATNYFQNYYNPSKENTKFSIHRNAGDGMITYAYLKYNLTSGKGREGSFFGMALVFKENSCCIDFLKLYRLFDTIYNKVILADGEILEPTDGTSYIQAKYKITRFNEKREYIMQKVLPNLLSNLNTFADAFIPVDDTFSSNQPDLGVRIPYENADNKKILNALRQYNRLSISPGWGPLPPGPEIPEEVLYRWHSEVPDLSLYVNKCFQNISRVNISEVKKKYNQCLKNCETFKTHTYPQNASEEIIQCYNETKEQYKTLYKSFESLITQIENQSTDSSSSQNTPPPQPPILPTPPTLWWKNTKIIAVLGTTLIIFISIIVALIVLLSSPVASPDHQPIIAQNTRNLISQGKYAEAIVMADSLDISLRKYLQDSAKIVCNNGLLQGIKEQMTNNHYTDAYDLLGKMYDGDTKNKIQNDIVTKCEEYLTNRLINVMKDKQKAKKLKDDIEGCKVPIDQTKKKQMIDQLNGIINATGGMDLRTSAPTYIVIMHETNRNFTEKNKRTIITKDTIIVLNKIASSRFVYCLETAEGVSIDDPKSIIADDHLKQQTSLGTGWYGVSERGEIQIRKGSFTRQITVQ